LGGPIGQCDRWSPGEDFDDALFLEQMTGVVRLEGRRRGHR
jgi:hypothetical protein